MASQDRDVLPDSVKPVHYAISLFDLELGGAYSYQGTVKIDVHVKKLTTEIVLNAVQLKIHSAKLLLDNTKEAPIENITHAEKTQRVSFHLPNELSPNTKASLVVNFGGTINDSMAGFYRSKYKPAAPAAASVPKDDDFHYMFSTQFESCDARRAFPCFDEPNLKATFDVELEIPEDQTALSNMPAKEVKTAHREGRQILSFDTTPIMSTYLLAWAVGDFEYVEDFTKRSYNGKHLPVRVYTTKGLKEQGRFALQNAHKIVDYFSEVLFIVAVVLARDFVMFFKASWSPGGVADLNVVQVFGIDYPLPKVDLLAVHEFADTVQSHGAMENWGLVTYRTTAVLFDEASSDAKYKNRVAYVVAHELAHQWFGNLVTMDWWSELWLNEGFATWVGWIAIDHLYPDWEVWGQFVTESVQTAFELDSLRGSHPIEVPVRNALDIEQIFDHISYLKGSSVIRMLSAHLGVKVFLQGVTDYLKAHAYGNATTNDLWDALSKTSGKNVNSFMDPWIRKIGFPVITVAEEPGQITVRQSRFLSTGDVKLEEDQTIWWIPLGLDTDADTKSERTQPEALMDKQANIQGINDNFYKLNVKQTGFYRTNYPSARLAQLGQSSGRLSVEDKIGLIGDAAALAVAGNGTTAGLLSFAEGFQQEENYLVWLQLISSLTNLRLIFAENETVANGLKKFMLKLVTPRTESIGWDFPNEEKFLTGQLRALLLSAAGGAGHSATISEAWRRFELYTSGKDKKAIHPSLRSTIFRIAIAEGGKPEYEAVKDEYVHTTSVDGKEICLQSLGQVQTPELANDFLDFVFSDQVALQDKHSGATALAENAKTRLSLWHYLRDDWTRVHGTLSKNPVVLDRLLRRSLAKLASREVQRDIASFFEGKDNHAYDRSLGVIADTIRGNANYKERDESLVLEWLKAHGYVQ